VHTKTSAHTHVQQLVRLLFYLERVFFLVHKFIFDDFIMIIIGLIEAFDRMPVIRLFLMKAKCESCMPLCRVCVIWFGMINEFQCSLIL